MIKRTFLVLFCGMLINFINVSYVSAKTDFGALHTKHDIIAKYECGDKGYQAISKDGYGGYSYGKWQISTQRKGKRPSTFDLFLTYLKENNTYYYEELINAGGYSAAYRGNKTFTAKWKKVAEQKKFRKLYDAFLLDTQIIPVYERMDRNGIAAFDQLTTFASEDNAVQAAVKSTIIQHGMGGAYKIFQNILSRGKVSKYDFLKKLYAHRTYKYPQYKKRYTAEYKDLRDYLMSGDSKITKHKDVKYVVKVKKLRHRV